MSYINTIRNKYQKLKFWLWFVIRPQHLASGIFRGIMGYDIDWKNPRDLNEKINWQKFYSNTSEWTRLADKYLARDYIAEKLGEDVLPKLYGVWEKAEDIDFTSLPDKFVMKTNHGCGGIVLVEDKNKLDLQKVKDEMANALNHKFGYETVEPHYLKIHPVVMAEEMIDNDGGFSSSIPDYKVFCVNGVPETILVCSDRVGKHVTLSFYDIEWNYMPEVNSGRHKGEYKEIPKPECLDQLLLYARTLAKDFPQVRVDFYIAHGKIYVGELTFTSQGGYMDYLSREFSLKLGSNVPLIKK